MCRQPQRAAAAAAGCLPTNPGQPMRCVSALGLMLLLWQSAMLQLTTGWDTPAGGTRYGPRQTSLSTGAPPLPANTPPYTVDHDEREGGHDARDILQVVNNRAVTPPAFTPPTWKGLMQQAAAYLVCGHLAAAAHDCVHPEPPPGSKQGPRHNGSIGLGLWEQLRVQFAGRLWQRV